MSPSVKTAAGTTRIAAPLPKSSPANWAVASSSQRPPSLMARSSEAVLAHNRAKVRPASGVRMSRPSDLRRDIRPPEATRRRRCSWQYRPSSGAGPAASSPLRRQPLKARGGLPAPPRERHRPRPTTTRPVPSTDRSPTDLHTVARTTSPQPPNSTIQTYCEPRDRWARTQPSQGSSQKRAAGPPYSWLCVRPHGSRPGSDSSAAHAALAAEGASVSRRADVRGEARERTLFRRHALER